MASSGLLLHTPPSATSTSTFTRPSSSRGSFLFYPPATRKFQSNPLKCKSAASTSSSLLTDFDLYDLLGIDSSSDQSQIKAAYRSLQKRCHPDIAGPSGHDMAIILNDAYSILSDPNSRSAYDKEHAKIAEFRGYTGKPIYSTWFGSESEERAVFVDEVKCVGCLKCALFAEKTFAIESVYGRARVVAQWADPEHKIQDAIQACPVDCISVVERSDLAALEFLMSKQPRGTVRMSAGNSVGPRVSNIFVDIKKFQSRFDEARDKRDSKELDLQREVRMSAFQAIRAISNWLYWQSPKTEFATPGFGRNLMLTDGRSPHPSTDKLRDAAAARRKAIEEGVPAKRRQVISSEQVLQEDYWNPSTNHNILQAKSQGSSSSTTTTSEDSESVPAAESRARDNVPNRATIKKDNVRERTHPLQWGFPLGISVVAAVVVRVELAGQNVVSGGGVNGHVGGSMLQDVVNSTWLQVILAGLTWYLIGTALVELVAILRIGKKM